MSKPGRNDPCSCGSGKKYKQCCLPGEQDAAATVRKRAAEGAAAAAAAARQQDAEAEAVRRQRAVSLRDSFNESMAYERACELLRALIKEGKLDTAEAGARALLADYPEQIDSLEYLAEIYEARGENKQAAEYYRQAIALIGDAQDYDPEFVAFLRSQADRLDPPTP